MNKKLARAKNKQRQMEKLAKQRVEKIEALSKSEKNLDRILSGYKDVVALYEQTVRDLFGPNSVLLKPEDIPEGYYCAPMAEIDFLSPSSRFDRPIRETQALAFLQNWSVSAYSIPEAVRDKTRMIVHFDVSERNGAKRKIVAYAINSDFAEIWAKSDSGKKYAERMINRSITDLISKGLSESANRFL